MSMRIGRSGHPDSEPSCIRYSVKIKPLIVKVSFTTAAADCIIWRENLNSGLVGRWSAVCAGGNCNATENSKTWRNFETQQPAAHSCMMEDWLIFCNIDFWIANSSSMTARSIYHPYNKSVESFVAHSDSVLWREENGREDKWWFTVWLSRWLNYSRLFNLFVGQGHTVF